MYYMIMDLILFVSFFFFKVNNDDKNNNLFRISFLKILIFLNLFRVFYIKILYRD